MKKKGKYEELLAEKESALAELQSKWEAANGYQEKWTNYMDSQVNDLIAKIPDGKKEFVNKVID